MIELVVVGVPVKVDDALIVIIDEADDEIVLLEVMEEETEIIDETVYEDFAVSELDTDMTEESVGTIEEEIEAVVVDVGVSFELKLPGTVIEPVKDGLMDDDPLTDDELDG